MAENQQGAAKTYFTGLNELRFMAATLVLLGHGEALLRPNAQKDYEWWYHLLTTNHHNAVTFFFVLSGFLITHLLLEEHRATGNISVRGFYIKRLLRIWPLYYWIILLALFVFPFLFKVLGLEYTEYTSLSAFFFCIFLPNVALLVNPNTGKIGHLWSIGVEEQFYLLWAPLMKRFVKKAFQFFVIALLVKAILMLILWGVCLAFPSEFAEKSFKFMADFALENMTIGGIGAWLAFKYKTRMMAHWIWGRWGQLFFFSLLLLRFSANVNYLYNDSLLKTISSLLVCNPFADFILMPSVYLYLILNVSLNPKCLINVCNRMMNYLGTISYGLYVYHMFVLYIPLVLLKKMGLEPSVGYNIAFYTIAFSVNVLVSALSYEYFEKRVLKLRPKNIW